MSAQTKPRLYQPDPMRPVEEGSPTFRSALGPYLDHLSLRVDLGNYNPEHFANIRRSLLRLAEAWHVALADGRKSLIPLLEPDRRPAIPVSASTAEDAAGLAAKGGSAVVSKFGDRPLSECSNDDLVRWLLANPQWSSGHTKRRELRSVIECFTWYQEEFGVKSPYRKKKLPKFVCKPRREATEAEYVALMRAGCRAVKRALWTLWNVSGVRTCEQREMLWSDFNWEGGFILTYSHKTARLTDKPRLVALTPRQLRFFRNLYRQRPAGQDHVFLNTPTKPWNRRSFGSHLRKLARKIGLDEGVEEAVSAYCIRHSFATQGEEAGVSRADLALQLGHESESMIRTVYSKASQKVRHVRRVATETEDLRRQARRQRAKEKPPRARSDGFEQPELF